jgi:signal transduction histidine kinase
VEKLPEAGGYGTAPAALVAPVGAFAAISIALVALARRWGDATAVGDIRPPEAAMAPAAAVGVLLVAIALLLLRSPSPPAPRGAGRLLAAATTALGLLVLGQYGTEWAGMEGSGMLVEGGGWWARRPSPITGFGLTFVGASFLALGARRCRIRRWAGPGAGITLVVALMGLVGHAYGASVLYGLNRWGGTSLSSASSLGALALGILFADPSQGVAAVAVSAGAGGHLLRRLTPPALLAPLFLGWATLAAQERGFFNAAFGAAVLVVSLIALIVGLVARQAMILEAVERERKRHDEDRERLLRGEQSARAEAERRRAALERVTESRTRLMRGFSHDVKNPLGAADAYAQLLEEGILGELSDRQRDSICHMRRSIHTSLRLINDLLELARAEAGQLEIECVETDVTQAAREVAAEFRAQADAAGLVIDVCGPEGLHAETDPQRVRQILANLLSNTVKYAPNGRATVTAAIRDDGESPWSGPWIRLSVSDTGPGIPADKREEIFQEFARLDPQEQQGAGVGLAISRRIARLLGGDLTVESEVGRGSTFTLWLPPAVLN